MVASLISVLAPHARAAGLIGCGPFNLGRPDDFRVPDLGYFRESPRALWAPTAAIVVEVLSAHDETYEKFDFYGLHGVDEVMVADPAQRQVRCFRREGSCFVDTPGSELLGITAARTVVEIDWP